MILFCSMLRILIKGDRLHLYLFFQKKPLLYRIYVFTLLVTSNPYFFSLLNRYPKKEITPYSYPHRTNFHIYIFTRMSNRLLNRRKIMKFATNKSSKRERNTYIALYIINKDELLLRNTSYLNKNR